LIVVMLDIDGVLVDGRPEDGAAWHTDLEADLGISPATLQKVFFEPFWHDIVTGKTEMMPRLEAALSMIGAPVSAAALRDYWYDTDSRIVPEVADWARAVRAEGIQVLLCTNQEIGRANFLLDRLSLGDIVSGIVYSAAIGAAKPDPEFFRRAGRAIPDATPLLIDDDPANVDEARKAGWRAIHYRGLEDLPARSDPIWKVIPR
jgi:putative hydrolase of the HAD superfamily